MAEQGGTGTPPEEEREMAAAEAAAGTPEEAATVDPRTGPDAEIAGPIARPGDEPAEGPEPEAPATAAEATGIDKQAAETLAPKGAEQAIAEAEGQPAQRRRRGSRGRGSRGGAQAGGPAPAEPQARPTRTAPRPGAQAPVVRAHAKYVRTSARKARLVCDHIRGKSVEEARAILAYTPRAVARDWSKLLESAVANAEHNHELVGDDLRVLAAFADEGPTLKRFRPRAMGRATRIRKRTSHLTITLTPKES